MKASKTAKVIATSFIKRDVRATQAAAWYEHDQNLGTPEAVLNMIKNVVQKDCEIDSGMPMDTLIVNNNSGYRPGIEYLNSINDTPSKSGKFKIIHRDNWGRSFGAYNAAFEMYKNKYDYWIFSEDDMYFSKDGYAKHYLDILNESEKAAFVAAIGLGRPDARTKHAHGGCGFTHRKYMEETIPIEFNYVNDENGNLLAHEDGKIGHARKFGGSLGHLNLEYASLIHAEIARLTNLLGYGKPAAELIVSQLNRNTRGHCWYGEAPFTCSLVHLGYNIVVPSKPKEWYEFCG